MAALAYGYDPDCPAYTCTIPPPVARCAEDEACWDCSTMGNRQCGPLTDETTTTPTGQLARTGGAPIVEGVVLGVLLLVAAMVAAVAKRWPT
ncbi:MAG: hypothetical protein AB7G37_06395 [Solirubrobacteraceae bacterium]